ncbi:hypothetical protein EAH87_08570 [Sphingomonas koreensis]|nr:hypothetical protein EAH87_08570 [Sphingomonas koreensis]
MRRLLLIATSMLLVLPDMALAAQQAQVRPRPAATKIAKPNPAAKPVARPSRPAAARPRPKPGAQRPAVRPTRPNPGGAHRPPQRPNPGNSHRPPSRPNPGNAHRPPPRPNPGNNHRPNRPRPPHKWPIWRPGQARPPHFRPIHRPGWNYPHGYRYRRWTIGLILPSLFLNQHYYYTDYDALGVGPPPYGYRWVRYGPDLLLVQRATGRVADVIYGAFY